MKYKAIIFDFDGVLNDTEGLKFGMWQSIVKQQGKKIDKTFYIRHCCGKLREIVAENLIKRYKLQGTPESISLMKKTMSKPILLKNIRPIAKNIAFLKKSHKIFNGNVAIATSQDRGILVPLLKKMLIERYIKEIVAGHEIKKPKPAPDIYLTICEKLKVKPQEAIVIEDSQAGVESAYNTGIGLIIAVPGEFTKLQDFSKAHIVIGKGIKPVKDQRHFKSINTIEALF